MYSDVGIAQLDLFAEEGVDLSRVCIGHCDSQPYLDYCLAILERGAYVAFDNIGAQMGSLEERIAGLVRELVTRGHAARILLSHDVGQMHELRYFGGRGFTYLAETFLPRLRSLGSMRISSTSSSRRTRRGSCQSTEDVSACPLRVR